MAKKLLTISLTIMLAVSVLATNAFPVFASKQQKLADKDLYKPNDAYSYIVSATTGKVVEIDGDALTASGSENDGNKLTDKSLFSIQKFEEANRVQITRTDNPNQVWVSNGENLLANGTKQATISAGSWEGFELEKTTGDMVKIKNFDGHYIQLQNDKLVIGSADKEQAESFYIIAPKYEDTSVYMEHKQTGNYIQANGVANDPLTVDGKKENDKIGDKARFSPIYGTFDGQPVMNFVSKAFGNITWKSGGTDTVFQNNGVLASGWESIVVVPNGDGTISFKDSQNKKYITVKDGKLACNYEGNLTNNEKFVIHTVTAPKKATGLKTETVTNSSAKITWNSPSETIYTGFKAVLVDQSTNESIIGEETNKKEWTFKDLKPGASYSASVRTVNADAPYAESEAVTFQTKKGVAPEKPTQLEAKAANNAIELSWKAVTGADSYDIYRAKSAYDKDGYKKIATGIKAAAYTDKDLNADKYSNYYKVVAVNENDASDLSDEFASLEKTLFGKNIYIFAPTDDTKQIDEILANTFQLQNDSDKNAQFNENRFTFYFKPGDYTKTKTIPVGFYTQIAGLGQTPYDVKLNNLEVPAYLPDFNATCNFWRSGENFSVMNTGDNTSYFGSYRPDQFNWSVAQAAPLRRIYSERAMSYDWNYGWASGGYVADSKIDGITGEGNSSGTFSGQQFYTRNSEVKGNVYGTTLNAFYQGVVAPNLVNGQSGKALVNGNGFSNWAIPTSDQQQQVDTNVATTPELREKPFLFLDKDGEYKVFVPALKKNSKGTSWSKDSMGDGKVVSLDKFYIAKEGDSASKINGELAKGKNIFFTPGVYHAEETIKVQKENTILLGTGMASIIPDNQEAAMHLDDVSGLTVAGLIFDAGEHSKAMLVAGEEGKHTSHASNPTLLADLFFRIGGTTDKLTKADDALIINSDDVIGDHFWIWRADHGTGVSWDGNKSKHGMIVNGDNVTSYALFNEHFQEYDTLWNGENGATYFYQNEKAYDPISQEAWMSHNGTVKGYAAYKVANKVKKHYAIGLGIYNVFINTGPTHDSSKVQIELDNAIEVPNAKDVLIENATLQTFAKEDGALQKFNHIINGTGEGVSSGVDVNTGEKGEGWSRKFILSYQNGVTTRGFNGSITEQGQQPTDENGQPPVQSVDKTALKKLIAQSETKKKADYTAKSWAAFETALKTGKTVWNDTKATQKEVTQAEKNLQLALEKLVKAPVKVDKTALKKTIQHNKDKKKATYTAKTWAPYEKAFKKAEKVLNDAKATQKEVNQAEKDLSKTAKALKKVKVNKKTLKATVEKNQHKKKKNYTSKTWKKYSQALKEAKHVLKDSKATQKKVDQADKNLKKAVKGLKKVKSKHK